MPDTRWNKDGPKRRAALKKTVITIFYDFLIGVGITDVIMTRVDFTAEKPLSISVREEDCLCAYATMNSDDLFA